MNNSETLFTDALARYNKGVEFHHIESWLRENNTDDESIASILKQLKAIHYLRRKKRGLKLVFAGSFLLVFGFLITLLLFHGNGEIRYAMYGMTIAGVILLLWGMVDIMGW